jgi:hypothetical protein
MLYAELCKMGTRGWLVIDFRSWWIHTKPAFLLWGSWMHTCASRVGYPELESGSIGFWFLFNLAIWHCSTSFQKLGLGLEIGLCVLTPFEAAQHSNGTHLAIKYLVNVLNVDSHDKYVLHMITYGGFAQICDCWTMICELFCRSQL